MLVSPVISAYFLMRCFGDSDAWLKGEEPQPPVGGLHPANAADKRPKEVIMTSIFATAMETQVMIPGNLHELVRGQEQNLLKLLEPVVRERSITLDLRQVERIDAAGIAALISLYAESRTAGHHFAIANASHRVAEILTLVGLDRILLSHNAVPCPQSDPCLARSAA
jgi:anti-anti-sigma factor